MFRGARWAPFLLIINIGGIQMATKAGIINKAAFNPKIKAYLMWYVSLLLVVTLAGVFLLPFWLFFGWIYLNKYFSHLECELTTRSLRFSKGFIFHTERTIPLDKIQDLTFKEGPLLKLFGLSILRIETAGSSAQGGPDLSLIGIKDAFQFRQQVLDQRDVVTDNQSGAPAVTLRNDGTEVKSVLVEIRDALIRIEGKLDSTKN